MIIRKAKFVKGAVRGDSFWNTDLPQVVLYGRSNAGKSSAVNALLQNGKLAIVSNMPGRTREINFFLVNDAFYLVDLPGYGYAKASHDARQKILDLILWFMNDTTAAGRKSVLLVDSKIGLTDSDREILKALIEAEESIVILASKADRLNQSESSRAIATIRKDVSADIPVLLFSSKTRKGIDAFWELVEAEPVEESME
jgi:GTP-binding protein